ncbi:hypothetical protein PEC301879_02300 [Pectobacterium carotovorum subsp. carotovorum]|nr:hypothetical protein PEC301879_02300 [Pectobacterium carotovorum subsp. carotovorum]
MLPTMRLTILHNPNHNPPSYNKKTNINHSNNRNTCCDSRHMGDLSRIEDERSVSLNGRIDFINQVVSNVVNEMPSRDTPITFISLESGGLLTEFFIHDKLKKSGYDSLNWRVIDTGYQNDGYRK